MTSSAHRRSFAIIFPPTEADALALRKANFIEQNRKHRARYEWGLTLTALDQFDWCVCGCGAPARGMEAPERRSASRHAVGGDRPAGPVTDAGDAAAHPDSMNARAEEV